jgi:hypothetical protein
VRVLAHHAGEEGLAPLLLLLGGGGLSLAAAVGRARLAAARSWLERRVRRRTQIR